MLYHIEDLDGAFGECRRVLRTGGHMLIYQMFATDLLEPKEAQRLWGEMLVVHMNGHPRSIEAAWERAGFVQQECVDLRSEPGEWSQERDGGPGRKLLHAARLLREPERYIARFGQSAYDTKLAECLWFVYRMIGKLSTRIYVLRKP
jgi:hypothetical protein